MDTKQRRPSGVEPQRSPTGTTKKRRSGSTVQPAKSPSRSGSAARSAGSRSRSAASSSSKRRQSSRSRAAAESRRNSRPVRREPRRPAPDVVYTPPKPFNRNRLLLQLGTVVAVVLAFTFGISIFFKVEVVTVSGAQKYTAWQVREASGIAEGDNLLTFGKAKAGGRIKAELPYVDTVRIGIKLPDTVNIEIKEFDVLYSIKSQDDTWWLITSDGEIVDSANSATAGEYTSILGVKLAAPERDAQASAYEQPATETGIDGVTAPVTVKASEQLDAALSIVQYLEANGIVGEAASVDVTDISNIELWYGKQYQVKIGDTSQLSRKVSAMKAAISQLSDYHTGQLDVSFTFWPDEVGYTPFA